MFSDGANNSGSRWLSRTFVSWVVAALAAYLWQFESLMPLVLNAVFGG